MNPPLVSILLPFFNAADTLPRCLESLSLQSFDGFELLAVDDGSEDRGGEIVRAYAAADPRIRLLTRPHQGIVATLNAGLRACRGEFIARMDADDWCHPRRLELQRSYLSDHPECALTGSLAEPWSRDSALAPGMARYHQWMNGLLDDGAMKANLFVESPIPHSSFFVRRTLYEQMKGYRNPPWPEDYDFLLRCAAAGAIFGKVPEFLLHRADRPGRLTRSDPRYKRKAMFRAKAHHFAKGNWMRNKTGVVIGGSGPSGRKTAGLLMEEGVPVRCFLDNRIGPPDRKVMGLPAHGYADAIPDNFFAEHRDAFFLSCIGEEEGRTRLREHLHANGFEEERDYLLFM